MKISSQIITEFKSIVGSHNLTTTHADLYAYGFDASIHHHTPDIVIRPKTADEISKILKIANHHKIPVIARGAGSGLCGQAVPIKGGIILDMCRMNLIKEIRINDLYCIVQPGVIYDKLNHVLKKHGYWFPTSPGSGEWCTIGGMVATNASGMRAIKYGATRDYVMGLEVVLADGRIIKCGTKTLKNSSGYQLEKLFVGSEGTLGIITEIILRITPLPAAKGCVLAAFKDIKTAGECVSEIIAKPITPSAIEILDKTCIAAVNKALDTGFPDADAILIIECDGNLQAIKDELDKVYEICRKNAFQTFLTFEDAVMDKWTRGRKAVLPALSRLGEKAVSVSLADDMAVPISKVADAVVEFQKIAHRCNVTIGIYGHAADGNLHTKMLIEPFEISNWRNAEDAVSQIYEFVLRIGGTVTGEHGVGVSKAPFMQIERHSVLSIMAAIKKALDPNNILNPGKLFEWRGSVISHLRYPPV
jgi:glycolate oxidase